MNADLKPTIAAPEAEPTSTLATLPMWLVVLMLLLLSGVGCPLTGAGGGLNQRFTARTFPCRTWRDSNPAPAAGRTFHVARWFSR
jgi:hypothetical protein